MAHDLCALMSKDNICELYEYFEVSVEEDNEELNQSVKNMFCNFEFTLEHELIPTIWNTEG